MALTATIHNFDVELADVDRGVYETLAVRVARHPSEKEELLDLLGGQYPELALAFSLHEAEAQSAYEQEFE